MNADVHLTCLSLNSGQKALIRVVLLHSVYILITSLPKPMFQEALRMHGKKPLVEASSMLLYKQKEQ